MYDMKAEVSINSGRSGDYGRGVTKTEGESGGEYVQTIFCTSVKMSLHNPVPCIRQQTNENETEQNKNKIKFRSQAKREQQYRTPTFSVISARPWDP